jgi:hypothetical protein
VNSVYIIRKAASNAPTRLPENFFGGLSVSPLPIRHLSGADWRPDGTGDSAMRVMVLVKATKDSEAGLLPSTEMFEAMGKFNEQLVEAGIMKAGEGLHPSSKGKRVAFDGAKRTVIDGPFQQTRELVAGFWLWEVEDMAEAVEWVKRCPNPMPGPSEIEIRPLYELADFGDAVTPEVAERNDRLREKVARG